jgi:hypothetical protein
MLVAAAIGPAAPLLARELTGADPVAGDLRAACQDATAAVLTADPDLVAVIGTAAQAREWENSAAFDVSAFAPALRGASGGGHGELPAALGLGRMLLDEAGYAGRRVLYSVAEDCPASSCAALGERLAERAQRTALLVMADGSARRTLKAPGYLDERSAPFDAEIERAIGAGDLGALLALDASLARELMATGRPAFQVLAGAAAGRDVTSVVRYRDDPFGVFYLVASLTC